MAKYQFIKNKFLRWAQKTSFSLADQFAISGANFILNILLARWLSPVEYGAFAITFSFFLFLSGLHNALILEPMSVIGPSRHENNLSEYLGVNILLHAIFTLGVGFIIAIVAIVLSAYQKTISFSLLGLAIATPIILIFWLLRRACYLEERPDLASRGSTFYIVLILCGLLWMRLSGLISPFIAFMVMAVASASVALVLWQLLKPQILTHSPLEAKSAVVEVLKQNWGYGRWVFGSAFVFWIINAMYIPVVGAILGLENAGAFRAIQNLMLPIMQTMTALGLLLLPRLSRKRSTQGDRYLRKVSLQASGICILITIAYVLVVSLIGKSLMKVFYGHSYYDAFLWLIPLLGFIPIINAIEFGFGITLRAAEKPKAIFLSQTAGALTALLIGILMIQNWGFLGAVLGQTLSALACLVVHIIFWKSTFDIVTA